MSRKAENSFYLGLDTSAYTTAVAVCDDEENLLFDRRLKLAVSEGELGLRQSAAVFQHINNVPALLEDFLPLGDQNTLVAVAASAKPRPLKNSYMPVFKVSETLGLFAAKVAGLRFFSVSHQEGHIMAGLWSAGLKEGRYLTVHFSGGTSEILEAEELSPGRLKIALLGGSSDLNAGQLIDRIGRLLGLPFPAGPALEALAQRAGANLPVLPVAVKEAKISFSGPATCAQRLVESGTPAAELARAVEICIADSLIKAISGLKLNPEHFAGLLCVGRVMANRFIASRLENNLKPWPVYYARPQYATDCAVGQAILARRLSGAF